ncbi:MAG: WD40/YVTN/BNR-like repeat-containing protein, partial [Candidatus Kapaibacterium sp.]
MKRQIFGILLISIATTFCAGVGFSQPNWIQTNGPSGGYITKIAVDSLDNYFAGTEDNGIYRSTNGGKNWDSISNGLQNFQIFSLTCSRDLEVYISAYYGNQIYDFNSSKSKWESIIRKPKGLVAN